MFNFFSETNGRTLSAFPFNGNLSRWQNGRMLAQVDLIVMPREMPLNMIGCLIG